MTTNQLQEETRAIYHDQHNRLNADKEARTRIHNMYTEEYFGLPEGWFKGKKVLDAGCGNMAVLMIRLASFGATELHGLDLGDDWIPSADAELQKDGVSKDKYSLKGGSVLSLPYEDESFDFVACNGVLVHLADLNEVEQAFAECARVLKKGGYFYTSYGTVGGIIEGVIFPALREHYRKNAEFKAFIDNIKPSDFEELLNKISNDVLKFNKEIIDCSQAAKYFDEDFCVYLQNAIQPPSRLHQECSSEYVTNLYEKSNFVEINRLKRYVLRKNLRKFFAPLHYDREIECLKYFMAKEA